MRAARRAVRNIYGINNTQLDLLLFVEDEERFSQKYVLDNFVASALATRKDLPILIDKGYVFIFLEKKSAIGQPRYYRITTKGKLLVRHMYEMLEQKADIPYFQNTKKYIPYQK